MRSWITLVIFIVAVVGTGLMLGYITAPGQWYAELDKPWFTPPNWLFAPVWTILYVIIAIVGRRVWRHSRGHPLKGLWLAQMALNFLWSPVFFGAELIALGLVVVLALLVAILIFMWKAWPVDRVSAMLFIPYAAWVTYASALNLAILALN